MKTSIIIFLFMLSGISSLSQCKPPEKYFLPTDFSKPKLWVRADSLRSLTIIDSNVNKPAIATLNHSRIPKEFTLADFLSMIKNNDDFLSISIAKKWLIKEYKNSFPYLIELLTDSTVVGLKDFPDSIYSDSVKMFFYSRLSTVAGRASYILNELTGENFSVVYTKSTFWDLKKGQRRWELWIKKLKTH